MTTSPVPLLTKNVDTPVGPAPLVKIMEPVGNPVRSRPSPCNPVGPVGPVGPVPPVPPVPPVVPEADTCVPAYPAVNTVVVLNVIAAASKDSNTFALIVFVL
jgi:hypothetical protein